MQTKPQYQEPSYHAPFRGWNSQAPEMLIPASDSPYVNNFILRNSEIRSAPAFKYVLESPEENSPVRGLTTFLDANNVYHTVAITQQNIWQLIYRNGMPEKPWLWNRISTLASKDAVIVHQSFMNNLYWTTYSPGVYKWDGMQSKPTIVNATFGGAFMGQLGFHLIVLNTIEIEGGRPVTHPQRIRWSASGLFDTFDPAVNPNAGYNEQYDVPDFITGYLGLGRAGFIFRTNGITQMSLTGNAAMPFSFDHLWASDKGIGNIFPYSLAGYGATGIFISDEDIYKISVSSFETIGGGARDAIFADLAQASDSPLATIVSGYSQQFKYLTYHLFIPSGNNCIVWIYNIEDKNWIRRIITSGYPTASMRNVMVV